MRRRLLPCLLAGLLAVGLSSCGGDDTQAVASETSPHAHTGLPAGDGTKASYVGYTLADAAFPTKAGVPGRYSFHIETFRGTPLTDYVTELTKDMHVYVVSTDLAIYRHVHPTMAADGTWSGMLTVPREGRYRMIAEFTARDDGGNGDQLVLGVEKTVGKPTQDVPLPPPSSEATTDGVTVSMVAPPTVGSENTMTIGLGRDGGPASLGTYLGVYAHVSAFNVKTGVLVHMHPLGSPEVRDGTSVLEFHSGFEDPGDYRMFVQTRISGVVQTLPITVTVG